MSDSATGFASNTSATWVRSEDTALFGFHNKKTRLAEIYGFQGIVYRNQRAGYAGATDYQFRQ